MGKRKNQEVLQTYKNIKTDTFDFERIALLLSSSDDTDAHQVIPYSTLHDLDFEEVFMYLDRTCSKIGQQHLYSVLRTIPKNQDRTLRFEKIIDNLNANPDLKKSSILEMSRLDQYGAYYLQSLFNGKNITKPKWFWIVPILSILATISAIASFIFPVFIIVFLLILGVNQMIHYWNKNNVISYSNSIPQLLTLNQVAKSMLNYGVILDADHDISKSNDALSEIANKALFFKWESRLTGEIGQFVDILLDLIKASFLLEPILMFKIIKELDRKRIEIQHVFRTVAEVDVALSIDSFRDGLAYYTKPNISERKKSFSSEDIYHPLILNPVTNSLNISHGQSVLLSGSNMSGKTTFIRTIGINAILAQTINTACAKKFTIPKIKIHSAIRITDNLLDESSYYYEEVKAIKKLINESESEDQNLFLLDELFKGTNTVERISSGKAVLSYLNQNDNIVLAATHDLELTEFLRDSYKYLHFTETIENDKFSFDYKLKEGVLINTNAIRILEINDFPKQLTEEAKAIAKQFRNAKRNSNEG